VGAQLRKVYAPNWTILVKLACVCRASRFVQWLWVLVLLVSGIGAPLAASADAARGPAFEAVNLTETVLVGERFLGTSLMGKVAGTESASQPQGLPRVIRWLPWSPVQHLHRAASVLSSAGSDLVEL
jgi:hypothetical protein